MSKARTVIVPYKFASASARALASALGIKRCGTRRTTTATQVINWGCSNIVPGGELMPNVHAVANHPDAVYRASNKMRFFMQMPSEVVPNFRICESVESMRLIADELKNDLHSKPRAKWFARESINGHSGEGIVVLTHENVDEYFSRPYRRIAHLFTRKFHQTTEFRVHFCAKRIFDVQQKRRRIDMPDDQVNWLVRNHHNGFIYARSEVELPPAIGDWITTHINKEGFELDFGAFDVLYSSKTDTWCILEVNTAPGLTGTTLENYANAFRAFI